MEVVYFGSFDSVVCEWRAGKMKEEKPQDYRARKLQKWRKKGRNQSKGYYSGYYYRKLEFNPVGDILRN